jgi:NhaA family Na+:H+ antiporter
VDDRHRTWASSDRFIPTRFIQPFVRFTRIEAASGIVLLAATMVALIWANSGASATYQQILHTRLTIVLGDFHLDESVQDLINDGLMAIFFFVVALEIKRELVLGELRDRRAAMLPALAALGGMIVPASIYLLINAGTGTEAIRGWGIPMATDIAFAVGVLALLGPRVPAAGRLFLLALAIVDDIGAIVVIAIFYTDDLHLDYLGLAVAALGAVWLAARVGIRSLAFYIPAALVAWFLMLESGVHATLVGVALGLLTPAHAMYRPHELDQRVRQILDELPSDGDGTETPEHLDHEAMLVSQIARESVSPLTRMEHGLVVFSSFFVVPAFALANAGVDFRGTSIAEAVTSPVGLGVILGLVVGKTVGISLFTFIGTRFRVGDLPPGVTWRHLLGLAAVGGIGFTVALFVTGLAFEDPVLIDTAKIGVFVGSAIAGAIGASILSGARKATAP